MSGVFVKDPGLQLSARQVTMNSQWSLSHFEQELRAAGVVNVGAGSNAQKWFAEVSEAVRAGCLTFADYVDVRRHDENARFCHSAAINLAASARHTP